MRQVDPAARQLLLDRLVAAHQALFTYSAQVKVEAVSDKRRESATASVVYQKPGKARVDVRRGDGSSALVVCDGASRLFSANVIRKKAKAEAGEKALLETLSQAELFVTPAFLFLVSRNAPVRSLLPGALKVLGFGTPTTLDGVTVEVVAADVATKDGEARLTFSIGKEDHLLRRLLVQTNYQSENYTLAETYTDVKANPKLDKKAFAL